MVKLFIEMLCLFINGKNCFKIRLTEDRQKISQNYGDWVNIMFSVILT